MESLLFDALFPFPGRVTLFACLTDFFFFNYFSEMRDSVSGARMIRFLFYTRLVLQSTDLNYGPNKPCLPSARSWMMGSLFMRCRAMVLRP